MKKLIILFTALLAISSLFVSCNKDDWSGGDPAYDHVYFVGFQDWGNFKNNVVYNVNQGDTVGIPIQFYSENPMKVDVITDYYIAGDLQPETDYKITDAEGNELMPDADGIYTLTWPKATKGVQRVYIKALTSGSTGSFWIETFDPEAAEGISYTNLINNKTENYEVDAFTENYKVKINIQ